MEAEIPFNEKYLERVISVEKTQGQILDEIKEIKDDIKKMTSDHEIRIRYVEVHGSTRAQEVDKVLCQLAKDHDDLKNEFHYQQGRLYFFFLAIGAGVSACISWFVSIWTGGN